MDDVPLRQILHVSWENSSPRRTPDGFVIVFDARAFRSRGAVLSEEGALIICADHRWRLDVRLEARGRSSGAGRRSGRTLFP